MRGKLAEKYIPALLRRITPAGAGKTKYIPALLRIAEDHPRRCGENIISQPFLQCKVGSPPQVRGKLYVGVTAGNVRGITPAGAGKTSCNSCNSGTVRDHPRRCGENQTEFGLNYVKNGSPPQVRGKLNSAYRKPDMVRITPAGAGKTALALSAFGQTPDHPRRCGENGLSEGERQASTGSPPQVRGKPGRICYKSEDRRITPAGAGKTQKGRQRTTVCQDHPRRCGENLHKCLIKAEQSGSPPQVRGKLDNALDKQRQRWITPAGAGKTPEEIKDRLVT